MINEAILIDSLLRTAQVGSLYALMAVGLTLTVSVLKLPNFAHAELITVGAYAALLISVAGVSNPFLILLIAFVVGAITAWIAHRAVFRPLERRRTSSYTLLLASFAVGLIVRYAIFTYVDANDLFDKRIGIPLQILFRSDRLIVTNVLALVVPASLLFVLFLTILLNRTALGREMLALADNPELARVIGVRVERVKDMTWLLVGGLAAVGGALWGVYSSVNPLMGWTIILSVFAASILGGLSSFSGTIVGAYLVALAENPIMLILNSTVGLDFSFKPAVPFVIIILALLIRPQGLTGFFRRRAALER